MLSWIPIIGPILQGLLGPIATMFGKFFDSKVAITQATLGAEVEETKVSAQIIKDTADDIGIRLMRDVVCLPVVVWSGLIGWDTIVAYRFPQYMWHVANYPMSVAYLPYAVLIFLLGNVGFNAWKRK